MAVFAEPMVRIRFPPAESQQTFGPSKWTGPPTSRRFSESIRSICLDDHMPARTTIHPIRVAFLSSGLEAH
jgi:hypothetical protein